MSTSLASERPSQLKDTMLAAGPEKAPGVFDSRLSDVRCSLGEGVKELASDIYTTIGDACVCVCVHNLTNFCPYALISTPNVP